MSGTSNWTIEASTRIRNTLLKQGRVFLGRESKKVQDHILPARCFKFQRFGHTAKYARMRPTHAAFVPEAIVIKTAKPRQKKNVLTAKEIKLIQITRPIRSNVPPIYVQLTI